MENLSVSFHFGGALGGESLSFGDFKKEHAAACSEAALWLRETPSTIEGHGWIDLPDIDTVQIKDGALYVNDELYKESTDVASMEDAGLASDPIELEKDEYFVLGDNRNNSEDSRYANIGNVKRDYIIGKAWFRFSGLGSFGTIK